MYVTLPEVSEEDQGECTRLAGGAASRLSSRARRGRSTEECIGDFFQGFMNERAYSLYAGPAAYQECLRQQRRNTSSFGPDTGHVDLKSSYIKNGVDFAVNNDFNLRVNVLNLQRDKLTRVYALIIQDDAGRHLVGWATKSEVLDGSPIGKSLQLPISRLHAGDSLLEYLEHENVWQTQTEAVP